MPHSRRELRGGLAASLWATLALLLSLLLAPTANAADGVWRRIETANFVIFSEGGERQALSVAQDLELFRSVLLHDSPPRQSNIIDGAKLTVFLTDSVKDFDQIRPGLSAEAAGFYSASADLTVMFSTLGVSSRSSWERQVLFHEYSHHYMLQYFPGYYPGWYVEAFAEFYMTTQITDDHVTIGALSSARNEWLSNGPWMSMEEMLTADRSKMSDDDVQRFYAQAWLFNHYITFNPQRRDQLVAYINALRRGEDPNAAFAPAFGVTPSQMQSALRLYARSRLPALRYTAAILQADTRSSLTRLPKAADELLLPLTRLRLSRMGDDAAKSLLGDLPNRIPKGAENDPIVVRVRALASLSANDIDGALSAAKALLEIKADDAEAHDIVGRALMSRIKLSAASASGEDQPSTDAITRVEVTPDMEATLREAGNAFAAAARADPMRAGTLIRLANTWDDSTDEGRAERLRLLRLARDLAPQASQTSLSLGFEFLNQEKPRDAIRVLRRLAADPHGGAASRAAQDLIDQANSMLPKDRLQAP